MQDKIVESYNKTELSKLAKTPYSRINKDSDLYIPIKIVTAQSRATERGYTVRYVRVEDIEKYLKKNSAKITYGRKRDKKFKKSIAK